jgi:hypothetical protein
MLAQPRETRQRRVANGDVTDELATATGRTASDVEAELRRVASTPP